jgi:hypothetical protein
MDIPKKLKPKNPFLTLQPLYTNPTTGLGFKAASMELGLEGNYGKKKEWTLKPHIGYSYNAPQGTSPLSGGIDASYKGMANPSHTANAVVNMGLGYNNAGGWKGLTGGFDAGYQFNFGAKNRRKGEIKPGKFAGSLIPYAGANATDGLIYGGRGNFEWRPKFGKKAPFTIFGGANLNFAPTTGKAKEVQDTGTVYTEGEVGTGGITTTPGAFKDNSSEGVRFKPTFGAHLGVKIPLHRIAEHLPSFNRKPIPYPEDPPPLGGDFTYAQREPELSDRGKDLLGTYDETPQQFKQRLDERSIGNLKVDPRYINQDIRADELQEFPWQNKSYIPSEDYDSYALGGTIRTMDNGGSGCPTGYVWDGANCIKDVNLPEQSVYGNEAKRKLQGSLIDKYNQAKGAYQDYRENAGLTKQRLKNEGASSIGVLQGQVKEYKNQLEEEKKTYDRAQKALNVLQKKDSANWKDKKLKDVMSAQGVDALRDLYSKGEMSEATYRDFYNNFGQAYDTNVKEGTGSGAEYSAKEAKDKWGESKDWKDFTGMVNKAAIAAPLFGGAGALTASIPAMGGASSGFIPAAQTAFNTSMLGVPGLTANNLLWGAGAYASADQIIDPKSATRTSINTAIKDPSLYNVVDAAGNVGMTGLGFAGLPVKAGLASLADDAINAPRLSLSLQNEAARLTNPEAYRTLRGTSSGVRGKISDYYFNSLQKNINKQQDILSKKVYKARQNGQDDLAEQYLEESSKLREKVLNEILPQQHNWRLKYSGLPISTTGKGGGQGAIYQNNLNPEELIKVGSYMGDEQSMNNLIELGKHYTNPDAVVAFPTKAVPYGMGRENLQVAQFMPKLDYKDWMPDAMTPEQIKNHLNELNKLGVGIDYQGAGNIGSVGNKLGLVDLTYVGTPGNRTNHYFSRQGVFNPIYRDTGKLGKFKYEVDDVGRGVANTNELPPPPNQIFIDNNASLNLQRAGNKSKKNIYKKTETINENGFDIKTRYRGDENIPADITIEGKSGYWQLKPNKAAGDNTWAFSANMDNQLESGKAMLKMNEKFPFPKPSILEPNNLSLDSYNTLLNMGKRKDWSMQFENYVPLNHSAKHSTVLKELDLPNTPNTSVFKSEVEAQRALEKVDEFLIKKGINEKAKIYSTGDSFGIEIPNFRLTRNYANGGSLASNIPTYYQSKGTPIYRDTTALPFAEGGDLDGAGDPIPGKPKLPKLSTNDMTAYIYDTVVKLIEEAKASGKIKEGEDLNAMGVTAQILLESGNGKSGLTQKYNNFGGIKANDSYIKRGGKYVGMNASGENVKSKWRIYDTPEEGLRDQISFYLDNPRYRKAGVLNAKTAQEHAQRVQNAGYAGNEKKYARQVMQMANSIPNRLKKADPAKLQTFVSSYAPAQPPVVAQAPMQPAMPVQPVNVPPIVQQPIVPAVPLIQDTPGKLLTNEQLNQKIAINNSILGNTINNTANIENNSNVASQQNPSYPITIDEGSMEQEGVQYPSYSPEYPQWPGIDVDFDMARSKSFNLPKMNKPSRWGYQPMFKKGRSTQLAFPVISDIEATQYPSPISKIVQGVTGYNPNYYENTFDEEGNLVQGELERAKEEGRPVEFQKGYSSIQDIFNRRAYNKQLEQMQPVMPLEATIEKAGGGFLASGYGSSLDEYYANGGQMKYTMYDVFENGTYYGKGGPLTRFYPSNIQEY